MTLPPMPMTAAAEQPAPILEPTPHLTIRVSTPRGSAGGTAAAPSHRTVNHNMSPQRAAATRHSQATGVAASAALTTLVIDMPASAPPTQQMERETKRKPRQAERRRVRGVNTTMLFGNGGENSGSAATAAGATTNVVKPESSGNANSANPTAATLKF